MALQEAGGGLEMLQEQLSRTNEPHVAGSVNTRSGSGQPQHRWGLHTTCLGKELTLDLSYYPAIQADSRESTMVSVGCPIPSPSNHQTHRIEAAGPAMGVRYSLHHKREMSG